MSSSDFSVASSSDAGETHVLKTLSNAIHTLNNIRELSEKTISDTNVISRKNSLMIESLSRELVLVRKEKSPFYSFGRKCARGLGELLQVSILHIIMFLASILTIGRYTIKSVRKLFKTKRAVQDAAMGEKIKAAMKVLSTRRSLKKSIVYGLNTLMIFLIIWCFAASSKHKVYNLHHFGIGEKVQLPSCRIAAWHIAPAHLVNSPFSDILDNGLPVVLYLRGSRDFDSSYGLDVLKNLAMNKYNVLAPVIALHKKNIIDAWSSLQKRSQGRVYAWFGKTSEYLVKEYASAMCNIGVPPHGIIMETKHIEDSGYQDMEIWSAQCSTKDNSVKQFKFVKCPLTDNTKNDKNIMQEEITDCFEAVTSSKTIR